MHVIHFITNIQLTNFEILWKLRFQIDLSWILAVLFRALSIFVLTIYLNLFGFETFWSLAYLMKVNPEKCFICNKIGI